jgi:hypothetical protein
MPTEHKTYIDQVLVLSVYEQASDVASENLRNNISDRTTMHQILYVYQSNEILLLDGFERREAPEDDEADGHTGIEVAT